MFKSQGTVLSLSTSISSTLAVRLAKSAIDASVDASVPVATFNSLSLHSYTNPIQLFHSHQNNHTVQEIIGSSYSMSFILIQLLNELLLLFHLTNSLWPFSLIIFFNPEFFLACLLQLFFVECPNFFSPSKPLNTYVYDTVFLTFVITKTSSDQRLITNLKFRIFVIMPNTIVNTDTEVNISKFNFYCPVICVVVFINCSI